MSAFGGSIKNPKHLNPFLELQRIWVNPQYTARQKAMEIEDLVRSTDDKKLFDPLTFFNRIFTYVYERSAEFQQQRFPSFFLNLLEDHVFGVPADWIVNMSNGESHTFFPDHANILIRDDPVNAQILQYLENVIFQGDDLYTNEQKVNFIREFYESGILEHEEGEDLYRRFLAFIPFNYLRENYNVDTLDEFLEIEFPKKYMKVAKA